jgi:hypothetical protein
MDQSGTTEPSGSSNSGMATVVSWDRLRRPPETASTWRQAIAPYAGITEVSGQQHRIRSRHSHHPLTQPTSGGEGCASPCRHLARTPARSFAATAEPRLSDTYCSPCGIAALLTGCQGFAGGTRYSPAPPHKHSGRKRRHNARAQHDWDPSANRLA